MTGQELMDCNHLNGRVTVTGHTFMDCNHLSGRATTTGHKFMDCNHLSGRTTMTGQMSCQPQRVTCTQFVLNANSTQRCFQVVTHSSSNWVQRCLTSVIRQEPVLSTWNGCWRWEQEAQEEIKKAHKHTHKAVPAWCCKILFMRMSHSLMLPSVLAEAMHVPLGWKSTWFTYLKRQDDNYMQ